MRTAHAHRTSRPRLILLVVALSLAQTGCAAMGGVVLGGGVLGATISGLSARRDTVVTVTFDTIVDVPTVNPYPWRSTPVDTLWMRNVSAVVGRIRSAHGDTLLVDLREVRTPLGTKRVVPGTALATVSAPRDAVALSVRRRREVGKGFLKGAGIAILFLVSLMVAGSPR